MIFPIILSFLFLRMLLLSPLFSLPSFQGISCEFILVYMYAWIFRSLSSGRFGRCLTRFAGFLFFLHRFFLGPSHAIFLTLYLLLLLFLKCLSTHYHTHPSLADRLKPICW